MSVNYVLKRILKLFLNYIYTFNILFPSCSSALAQVLFMTKFTSRGTSRYVAVFPSNIWVSGKTPWSIRATTVRVTTHVEVIFGISDVFRNPPVTMRTLRFPRLTFTTRLSDVHFATVTNSHTVETI